MLSIPEDMEEAIMPKKLSDNPKSFPAMEMGESEKDFEDTDESNLLIFNRSVEEGDTGAITR